MKRKVLSLLLCGLLACSTLTACGGKETTTGDIPVTDASGQETEAGGAVEVVEPTTEETEITEEVESTEEVADDFLSQHGISINPNSSDFEMTVPLAVVADGTPTDDVEDVTIQGMLLQITPDAYEGCYTDELIITMPLTETGNAFNITAFDRYTGRSFESAAASLDDGSVAQSITVDIDGTKYDCIFEAYFEVNDNNEGIIKCFVTHPMEYDGVVFAFGQQTKTQMDAYNNIDFNSTFTVADYPDVFIDGQTFFTISGK